jgi:hypothetical protein
MTGSAPEVEQGLESQTKLSPKRGPVVNEAAAKNFRRARERRAALV